MTLLQKLKLWWLTSSAKSAYAAWYRYAYGIGGNYSHRTDRYLGDQALQAEWRMNEYRGALGLPPLWSYSGHWAVADGKDRGLNGCSKTAEQYWTGVALIKRTFDC